MGKESGDVRDIAETVKGIVEAVPVYEDAIQPGAKQIGRALETVGKAVNVALTPIAGLVWAYDRIGEWLVNRLAEKLQKVPPERIRTPSLMLAGPTLEALRFAGSDESLRELYANLLATSLDSETAITAHPSFVSIIRDMSPDEAKIMHLFAAKREFPLVDVRAVNPEQLYQFKQMVGNFSLIGREAACAFPELTPNYLDNLCRLGLLEIPGGRVSLLGPGIYEPLEDAAELESVRAVILEGKSSISFKRKLIHCTNFGWQFCKACVVDRAP